MKKLFFIALFSLIALGSTFVYQYFRFHDGKLHIVFCDVGQGDGILIITPGHKHILVDSGPDQKVVACLSRHMPFWERTLDVVFLTHPHSDHFYGLFHVLDRYSVLSFGTEKLSNKAASFQEVMRKVAEKKIPQHYLYAGDRFVVGDVKLTIEAPTKEFLQQTSPDGFIGEGKEFANLITHLSYGSFDVLLTGDSQAGELMRVATGLLQKIDVLQVPHHGSASGLTAEALQQLNPKMAVISVGAKNRYGHPRPQILQLLKGIRLFRTDQRGDIEIVSDGKGWEVLK